MGRNEEFVDQFERFWREIELVIRQQPPELHQALRDEARVELRLRLQEQWEARQRALELGEGR